MKWYKRKISYIKWTECGLNNISQNEQRAINYLHQWEYFGLMLLFFQITDQTFTDKCECVTKWKYLLLKRIQHLCNAIYFLSNYKYLIFNIMRFMIIHHE